MGNLIPVSREKLVPLLKAFPYQTEAIEAIWDFEYAAVFHEQGLGKTKIAIDVALHWLSTEAVDTVLIITKKLLINNWVRECKVHCKLNPAILSSSRNANFEVFNRPCRIVIANYEIAISEKNRLLLYLKTRDVGIILDESTKIKNPASRIYSAFICLRTYAKRRLILTGTPMSNRPYDIWAQIQFLDGGLSLGYDFFDFKKRLDIPKNNNHESIDEFETSLSTVWESISSFAIRETKDSGVIQLPSKTYTALECDWEDRQYEMYSEYKEELKAIVVKNGIPKEDNAEVILKRLIRLVQICSNPKLIDDNYGGIPGKIDVLSSLITSIRSKNEKAIIWTSFIQNADSLTSLFRKYNAVKVHGSMNYNDRNKSIDRFLNDDTCSVFIATPASAKEGLTLTVANHAIYYDRNFSLDDYLQSQDRIHRISQQRPCYIYNLLMRDSIDQWIQIMLEAKRTAARFGQNDITLEDFQNNMRYDFPSMLNSVLGIDTL